MKPSPQAVFGIVMIGAILAAAAWYASDPDAAFLIGNRSAKELPKFTVSRIEWSANGLSLLASFRGGTMSGVSRLALHDLGYPTPATLIDPLVDDLSAAALSPDGTHALVGSLDGQLWWQDILSAEPPTLLLDLSNTTAITAAMVAPAGNRVAAGTTTGAVCICDPAAPSSMHFIKCGPSSITNLRFGGNGNLLLVSQANGSVSLWEVSTRHLVRQFGGCAGFRSVAEFLPGNEQIIATGLDDIVRIWNIDHGDEVWRGAGEIEGAVYTLAVSVDGTTAAWGGNNRKVVVWDLVSRQKRLEIVTSMMFIRSLKFGPDGSSLAVAGGGQTIRFYNPATGREFRQIDVASQSET